MDKSLPFFAYGSLKTGQLAHRQIKDSCNSLGETQVSGFELVVADGIPRAVHLEPSHIWGELMTLTPEGYAKVEKFEQVGNVYHWEVVNTGKGPANMLVNSLGEIRTRSDRVESWRAVDDTFFAYTTPWAFQKLIQIKKSMSNASAGDFEKQTNFLELQALFTVLWSLFERITLFQEGPMPEGETLKYRVNQIERLPSWAAALEAARIDSRLSARSNSRPAGNATYAGTSGFGVWHTKRNNIVHRGKTANREITGLLGAAIDMHNTLAIYLQQNSDEINKFWGSLTIDNQHPYSSWLYQIRR